MHKRFLLESIPLRDDRRQMNGFKLKLWINAQFSQEIIGAVDKVRSPLNHQIEFPLATQAHRRRSSVSNGDSKREPSIDQKKPNLQTKKTSLKG